ncbi:MAG: hypothetical protein U0271_17785 [Polyangiaceae bacterium]
MNRAMLCLVGLLSCGSILIACGDDSTGGGGSGATGGSGGSGATGGAGGGEVAATCADYCATITSGCTANNKQYQDAAACEAECAAFDAGTLGAMSGNSLECRAYHAGVAAGGTDPAIHCVHAGPLGGGPTAGDGCGTDACESFCQISEQICSGDPGYVFDNFDDCMTQCATYTDDTDFNMMVTSGDNLACRMYHLSVAATGDLSHCAHLSGALCQ